jgi:hypothetical protein
MTELSTDDWVTVPGQPWRAPLTHSSTIPQAVLLVVLYSNVFGRALAIGLRVVIAAAVLVVLLGALVAVTRLARPRLQLNPATATLRSWWGRATYSQITAATLIVEGSKKRRALTLIVRTSTGVRAAILIRDPTSRTLQPETALLAQDMIRQSNITIPVSPDDPSGRYVRSHSPHNVAREEALSLVAYPPECDDALPIPGN